MPALAQVSVRPVVITTVGTLPAAPEDGRPYVVVDGQDASDCDPASGGGGSHVHWCLYDVDDGTYSAVAGGGGGTDDQTAVEVPYSPTTGTDWTDPDPTEAGGALDTLADRLTVEEAKADDTGVDGDTGATDNAALRADGAGGSSVQPSTILITDGGGIVLPAQASQPHAEGLLYYSSSTSALEFLNAETEVELQVGEENWIRVYNDSGAAILNGSVVYASGKEDVEDRLTVDLARADAADRHEDFGSVSRCESDPVRITADALLRPVQIVSSRTQKCAGAAPTVCGSARGHRP
jgi:hypothetical protein